MTDNVTLPGTGEVVATDDIGGVQYQRVKLDVGGDGATSPVTKAAPLPASLPLAASAAIMSVTTAATGANWTAFSSQACNALDIVNTASVAIEYRRGGTGNAMTILSGSARLVIGIANANEVDVRRVDQSNTQVTIPAEAVSV
jgi:hypothetical protein